MRRCAGLFIALVFSVPLLTNAAAADEHGRFRHRDIHRFHEHDYDMWRQGRWYHGRHEGHDGWWWIAGGIWYFYPAPVYPYPDPYRPPVIVAPPPSAPQYWYYCPDPPGYYPYVAACRTPWTQVVPQPAPPPRR